VERCSAVCSDGHNLAEPKPDLKGYPQCGASLAETRAGPSFVRIFTESDSSTAQSAPCAGETLIGKQRLTNDHNSESMNTLNRPIQATMEAP
jgi:hypothetical protein